jgi:Icc-related predicted phosphoesterase
MGLMGKLGKKSRSKGPRLLFATDVHGSDLCFRKFLNAAKLYDARYLVLGGDITGKTLVPIIHRPNGSYDCEFQGIQHTGIAEEAMDELRTRIRGLGNYYAILDEDELARMEDAEHRDAVFRAAVQQGVREWMTLAEERLDGTGIRCFMAPGNDDFFSIDAAIEESTLVEYAENRVLRLEEGYEMMTTGYANPTPWHTERELPEDELRKRLDAMADQVQDPTNLIAVIHPPPFNSGLDDAPQLTDDLELVRSIGEVAFGPVGSTAVREFIEARQPLISLHGHVHDGRGTYEIGRTLSVNPGSAYPEGILNASLVELGEGTVLSHQFVSG